MPVPLTFKGAVLPSPGAPGTKHIMAERTLSTLKPGEVAIKVTATAINPIDWKMRDTGIFLPSYPAVMGSDAAGEIAAVGPDVVSFAVGDRVFFQGIIGAYESSTFQQYCKIPAVLVAKTPANISDEQAAGIWCASMAAVVGLYDTTGYGMTAPWDNEGGKVGNGKAIIIIGGSSSVGQYAIQLARLSGFERIVTNASPANIDHLKSLGAHVVLDRTFQSEPEDFHKALGDLTLHHVLDCISAKSTLMLSIRILQGVPTPSKATLVRIPGEKNDLLSIAEDKVNGGIVDPEITELSQSGEYAVRLKGILGVGSAAHLRHLSEPLAKHLGREDGYIARGVFIPNQPVVVPGGFSAIDEALEKNKKGVSGEKVVVRPFEEAKP